MKLPRMIMDTMMRRIKTKAKKYERPRKVTGTRWRKQASLRLATKLVEVELIEISRRQTWQKRRRD